MAAASAARIALAGAVRPVSHTLCTATPTSPHSAPALTQYMLDASAAARLRGNEAVDSQGEKDGHAQEHASLRRKLQIVIVRLIEADTRRRSLIDQHRRFIRARTGSRQPEIADNR